MKKMMMVVLVGSMGCVFGMHRAFTGPQVKDVLDQCTALNRLIPFFDAGYEHSATLLEMQQLMVQLQSGVVYCQGMGPQLDVDGWPKAVRDVAVCRRALESAIQKLQRYIDYAQDPVHAPHPAQPAPRRVRVMQFDEE